MVRLVSDIDGRREGERVRDLEVRIQAMSDKMQRDKEFFFLVIFVIVIAFVLTRNVSHGQPVYPSRTQQEPFISTR